MLLSYTLFDLDHLLRLLDRLWMCGWTGRALSRIGCEMAVIDVTLELEGDGRGILVELGKPGVDVMKLFFFFVTNLEKFVQNVV